MSAEENKALVRRYREIYEHNTLAALDEIVATDLISHSPLPGLPPGLEGGKLAHVRMLAAFPDLQTTTADLIAEGDRVVERFTVSATDTGGVWGRPPTGKKVLWTGISIFRIADGKIVEHWAVSDALGLLHQLGILPPPALSTAPEQSTQH